MAAGCATMTISTSEPVRLTTTRLFIAPGQFQRTDFGLYTYILLPKHPGDDETRARDLQALRTFLTLEDIREFPTDTPSQRGRLNVTAIPVWSGDTIVGTIRKEGRDKAVDLLVEREYRYSRAQQLLSMIPEAEGNGPFLLSSPLPLSEAIRPPLYVIQDLSWVPPRVVDLWVSEFLRVVAKEQTWDAASLPALAIELRAVIAILAEGVPEVVKALKEAIEVRKAFAQWIKSVAIGDERGQSGQKEQKDRRGDERDKR